MKIKDYTLDKEEQELFDEIEKGNFVSVENLEKVKKETIEAAKNTLNKKRILISEFLKGFFLNSRQKL